MRLLYLTIFAVVATLTGTSQNSSFVSHEDDYSIPVVQGLLRGVGGFQSGVDSKQSERLGDRAAIAVLKAVPSKDLSDVKVARRVLAVLRDAFAYPEYISNPSDKEARVTFLLLDEMMRESQSPDLQREIAATKGVIQGRLKALHNPKSF
jgi:hypothetical protein